jgi:uncharacterized protein YkwD
MKKIIILFLLAIQFVSAQTKLDSLVFGKVNQYRLENGLKEFKFDTVCFKSSKHHTSYLYRKNLAVWPNSFCGHSEDTLKDHSDRYKFYSNNKRFLHLGEVAQSISKNYKVIDTDYLDKMASSIVDAWKSSPKHNELILKSDFLFGGVSCQYFTKSCGINTYLNYRIVATMLLVKNN